METTDPQRGHQHATGASSQPSAGSEKMPGIRHVIAVGSGKGGVGKSTVSVNLAFALQQIGGWIGLVDADLFGSSIPGMLGLSTGQPPAMTPDGKIVPADRNSLKVMSMSACRGDPWPRGRGSPSSAHYPHGRLHVRGEHSNSFTIARLLMPTNHIPATGQSHAGPHGGVLAREKLPGVRHIVAVASGKGGVGKSTVSVNLALALHQMGLRTGLVDADLFGPSIPVMLGIPRGPRPTMTAEGQIVPLERSGLKVISMGILTGDDEPAILRGPMVSKYLQAFVTGVAWDQLDYLILDLPPGTGDTQLTLSQGTPLSGAIIVTTPQDVSLRIARRGLRMFEKVQVPILGIIENMSGFVCSHCGETTDIFRRGGGRRMSEELGVPFLGAVPIDPEIVTGGDEGRPILTSKPDSHVAVAYRAIATQLVQSLAATPEAVLEPFVWNWGDDKTAPPWLESAVTSEGGPIIPVGLRRRDPRTLSILWQDGQRHDHDVRDLRLACPCAVCIDETTGQRRLDPKTVRQDVAPGVISSVGSYAINIAWNDGHSTGFYSFEFLRSLADRTATQATYDV